MGAARGVASLCLRFLQMAKKKKGGEKKEKAPSYTGYVDNKYEGDRNAMNQYHGFGTYKYCTAAAVPIGTYRGQWQADLREGVGILTYPDGSVVAGEYRRDSEVNEGVQLSPDRKHAWRRLDGIRGEPISLDEADHIARKLGWDSIFQLHS